MPSVTVAMKSYLGRDSENDRGEGVTAEINKCAECDSDNKKVTLSVTREMTGRKV
jgi:hypothetical protein